MTDYTPGGTFRPEVGLGECELLNVNSRPVVELKNIIKFSTVEL